jgi:hypothetical protein
MSWQDIGGSRSSDSKVNNLRLQNGQNVVRFIGDPKEFFKHFVNNRSAVTGDPENCRIKVKHGIEPARRFAVNVIDRSDGQLKLLECPITVLKPVVVWRDYSKKDPGGRDAVDFIINVSGSGKNKKYQTTAGNPSSLSESELEMIKKSGGTSTGYDLERLYKPTPQDEIEERLGFTSGSKKVETVNASPASNKTSSEDIPF